MQFVVIASFVAPWLLLLAAWKSKSHRFKHWTLTLFVTIYGATIAIAFDPLGAGPDGVRLLLHVHTHYVGLSFDQFLSELVSIMTFAKSTGPSTDVYRHVLSYFVGGVIGAPFLFFQLLPLCTDTFFPARYWQYSRISGEPKFRMCSRALRSFFS